MSLPPALAENLDKFYGPDCPFRIYSFIATGFFLLTFSRGSHRLGWSGVIITVVLYYVIGFIGTAFKQFTPQDDPKPVATPRRY